MNAPTFSIYNEFINPISLKNWVFNFKGFLFLQHIFKYLLKLFNFWCNYKSAISLIWIIVIIFLMIIFSFIKMSEWRNFSYNRVFPNLSRLLISFYNILLFLFELHCDKILPIYIVCLHQHLVYLM